jgi:hypothetical protein
MKKSLIIGFFMLSIFTIKAQNIFFHSGRNITTYAFNDNAHPNVDLYYGTGYNYEIGLQSSKKNKKQLLYSISATVDQYNASGTTAGMDLDWKTNYLGIKGAVFYPAFHSKSSYLAIKLDIAGKTILEGNQKINSNHMSLKNQTEFSGAFLGSGLGLIYNYNITPLFALQVDYNYEKQFNVSNKSLEKLIFNNHSINIGFSIKID